MYSAYILLLLEYKITADSQSCYQRKLVAVDFDKSNIGNNIIKPMVESLETNTLYLSPTLQKFQ